MARVIPAALVAVNFVAAVAISVAPWTWGG
jgi:hypothetical protein